MQTIPVEIPDKLAAILDAVCLENSKIKQDVIKELLIRYLEDIEDIADAERIVALNEPAIPFEEIERRYGLAD